MKRELERRLSGVTNSPDWEKRLLSFAEREWHTAGYLDAKIKIAEERSTPANGGLVMHVAIAVQEGQRYRLDQMTWRGVAAVPEAQLAQLVGMRRGDVFNPARLLTAAELIERHYHRIGYATAVVMPQFQKFERNAHVNVSWEVREGTFEQRGSKAGDRVALCNTQQSSQASAMNVPVSVLSYDPQRDALIDISQAKIKAAEQRKNVLVIVGGDWCPPCRALDRLFASDAGLRTLRDRYFVTVLVNYSEENTNECALKEFQPILKYPHIVVVRPDGSVLASTPGDALEYLQGFDPIRVREFLLSKAKAELTVDK